MVVYGFYEPEPPATPSPYVSAYVHLPRLGILQRVEFLIDSGSTGVMLHSADVRRLAIPQELLRANAVRHSRGIGGVRRYYPEPGTLSFDTEPLPLWCDLDFHIIDDSAAPSRIPSLLGRDFLNLCDVRLNYHAGLVSLAPVNVNDYGEIARR